MQKRPLTSFSHILGFASFGFLLVNAQPSSAAFQWVAPEGGGLSSSNTMNQRVYTPPASQASYVAPVVVRATEDTYPLNTTIIEAPMGGSASGAPTNTSPSSDGDGLVLGFADSVPLAVALRQILPKEYGFSVAQDVSLDTLVSWQGGASWRRVIGDMLDGAGLRMREDGKMVRILAAGEMQRQIPSLSSAPVPVPVAAARDYEVPVALAEPIRLTAPTAPTTSKEVRKRGGQPRMVDAAPLSLTDANGVTPQWVAQKGRSLHEVLREWSARANVDLSWQSEYDYPLQATVISTESFESAVRQLLVGFQNAQPQPYGDMHRNQSAGQMVLVIRVRGDNSVF